MLWSTSKFVARVSSIPRERGFMPELRLTTQSPLADITHTNRQGSPDANAGVSIAVRSGLALASVMARRHATDTLARRVKEVFDIGLPREPRRNCARDISFAWAGPGHWLAVAEATEGHAWVARLRTGLSGLASVSEQTDGRVVIRIRGPNARGTLAKGLPIDLHRRAFQPGYAAVSVIGHIGIQLWQIDDEPSYEMAVPTSYARSFWHWLTSAAAEFGISVEIERDLHIAR
jgi:methylglutamate dehydrogenase subunit D